MDNFIKFAFLYISFCVLYVESSSVKGTSRNENKTTSDSYPPICDNPPSTTIDPEKCCKFPILFDDSISQKCEEEFGAPDNSTGGDMVSDGCVIECMFNRSGLNKDSKLHREDVTKFMTNKTKNDSEWTKVMTKAVDACFNELSGDDLEEIAEHIRNEVGKNLKFAKNKICHPVSSITLDCIYRELYKVCPKEKFAIDLSECSALQNYTKTCDDW